MSTEVTEPLEDVCEHVSGVRYQVSQPMPPGMVALKCPCCGLRAWQEPGEPLDDGDPCPYCVVQPVLAVKEIWPDDWELGDLDTSPTGAR